MTGIYADTSNIVDDENIDAADVKIPIDALDTALADVAGQVTTASNDIAQLQIPIGQLENDIALLQAPIQQLQDDAVSLQNQIDDLENIDCGDVDELIAGNTAFDTLNFNMSAVATISAGAITATHSFMTIDTEANAATDDLETITGADGDYLMLQIADNSRVVVVKHGAGNIITPTGRDVRLRTTDCVLVLQRIGSAWLVTSMPPATEGATIHNSTAQSIPNSTNTAVSFNNAIDDSDAMFTVSNPTLLTVHTPGVYLIGASIQFANNTSGYRQITLSKNGAVDLAAITMNPTSGSHTIISIASQSIFSTGDYIECFAFQNSGSALALNTYTFAPILWAQRVS